MSDWYNFCTVVWKQIWQWNDTSFFWYLYLKCNFWPLEPLQKVLTAKTFTLSQNIKKSSCHSIAISVFKIQSKNCINRTKTDWVIRKTVTIPFSSCHKPLSNAHNVYNVAWWIFLKSDYATVIPSVFPSKNHQISP